MNFDHSSSTAVEPSYILCNIALKIGLLKKLNIFGIGDASVFTWWQNSDRGTGVLGSSITLLSSVLQFIELSVQLQVLMSVVLNT